jgi:hypothetical protein
MPDRKKIKKLVVLYKKKKLAEENYRKALNEITAEFKNIYDYPFRFSAEGFEFIKTKDDKIFLRKYSR